MSQYVPSSHSKSLEQPLFQMQSSPEEEEIGAALGVGATFGVEMEGKD